MISDKNLSSQETSDDSRTITLFLCGDVMTGRGIDGMGTKGGSGTGTDVNGNAGCFIWGGTLKACK